MRKPRPLESEFPLRAVKRSTPTKVPSYWNVADLASQLSLSRVYVWKLVHDGRIRGLLVGRPKGNKRGGRLLISESEVLRFLREGEIQESES